MTFENYEKAQGLLSKIEHYKDIKYALNNSVGRYMRISATRYVFDLLPTGITHNTETKEEIINTVAISEDDRPLMNRLIAVITEDIRTLQEEFDKL